MCIYKLRLISKNHGEVILDLQKKQEYHILLDYNSSVTDICVYNDDSYKYSVLDNEKNVVNIESVYINNEYLSNSNDWFYPFVDCFGIVQFEVNLEGITYVTNNINVMLNKNSFNRNIINMIDYIEEYCEDFLYEEHKNSKALNGIKVNPNISIDSRLNLMNQLYDDYVKCFSMFKNSAQTKLINVDKIGSFNDLYAIKPSTIRYISEHPEQLQVVNYNSGIIFNKQYFQPNKTLVKSVTYSYDTYENKIILGFLKTIIIELDKMLGDVKVTKSSFNIPKEKDGYIESSYYIYRKSNDILNKYIEVINKLKTRFQKLYSEYLGIFNINDIIVSYPPNYTNVFRNIMPYRIIFKKINDWFKCGNYDLAKSDLILSFLSLSKIYEYFCLIKINKSFIDLGFEIKNKTPYKYNELKYYINTVYNNTFEFVKDNINATVYFQPIVYGRLNMRDVPNNIYLYRNTSLSINANAAYILDDLSSKSGNYYTPDFLIKLKKGSNSYYYIIDAKHMSINNVTNFQLPYLVYKYLFSISTINDNDSLHGMSLFCGKEDFNNINDIHDLSKEINKKIIPSTHILGVSGQNAKDNTTIIELLDIYIHNIEDTSI